MLDEDESFSITTNVTTPGYSRMALKGFLVSKRSDGTYIAPLIPQLFYGASGAQLQTWRQNLPTTGNQVIISRAAGGFPKVPKQQLYWRKIKPTPQETVNNNEEVKTFLAELPTWLIPLILVIGVGSVAFYLWRKK